MIGAFGEGSADMHRLVNIFSSSRSKFLAQSTGYATSSREMSQIVGQIRRKLSTAFMRAIGLCTLSRVANLGSGSNAAAKRREWAISEEIGMKNERRAFWNAFVRGGGFSYRGDHFCPR